MKYMPVWLVITIVLVVLIIASQIFFRILFKGRLKKDKKLKIKTPPAKTRMMIKREYLYQLDCLAAEFSSGRRTVRAAYQEMSLLIRNYVHEMTGIRVQDCTLSEIRSLGMPNLEILVESYYEPEFAKFTRADIRNSFARTRRVIETWL